MFLDVLKETVGTEWEQFEIREDFVYVLLALADSVRMVDSE